MELHGKIINVYYIEIFKTLRIISLNFGIHCLKKVSFKIEALNNSMIQMYHFIRLFYLQYPIRTMKL